MIKLCRVIDCNKEVVPKITRPTSLCYNHKAGTSAYKKMIRSNLKIENPEKLRQMRKTYVYNRRKRDPIFLLKGYIRYRISKLLKGAKDKPTQEILGCSDNQFKLYIESKFRDGMSWNNIGKVWQLDHIKPISLAITKDEVYKLSHYTNLQPLLIKENLLKSNKY